MLVHDPARSDKIISLTRPLSHELFKKVLSVYFSHSLPYIDKILSTSECSLSYRPPIEMGIVSYVSSFPQLDLIKLSA